ncbi:DUF6941 family protein [Candidatus Palauibacter sp.]|uniref:DUF6941 family protein n=1 Tax=Candidatus Palauibacter sp. TaxID=3101350 RepID=UPI003B5A95B8
MEIALAALADYASISREGKLSVMGIFNGVATNELPARISAAHLVVSLELEAAEAEREHTVEIKCMDADGATAFAISGKFTAPPSRRGEILKMDQILRLENMSFNKEGDYSISIFANNDLKRTLRFRVTLRVGSNELTS